MGLVMDENKDAIIRQQSLIIKDQLETIDKQRCRIVELEYNKHQYDLIYTNPISFLWWFWRSRIFPLNLIYGHERVD